MRDRKFSDARKQLQRDGHQTSRNVPETRLDVQNFCSNWAAGIVLACLVQDGLQKRIGSEVIVEVPLRFT